MQWYSVTLTITYKDGTTGFDTWNGQASSQSEACTIAVYDVAMDHPDAVSIVSQ